MIKPVVGFVGLGCLGLPLAVAVASRGFKVLGYDVKMDKMKKRQYEHRELGPTNEDDFQKYFDKADLTFLPLKDLLQQADIVFVVVQTPHGPQYEGVTKIPYAHADFDYAWLKDACIQVSKHRKPNQVIVVSSTVLPGTLRREIVPYIPDVCYNPAFPAMGTVMENYLNPEFVLLSGDYNERVIELEAFYRQLLTRETSHGVFNCPPIRRVSIESAELLKVSYNTFITAKITLTNNVMEIAHKIPGCSCDEVSDVLALASKRICSSAYMRGGMGDSGPCFSAGTIVITDRGPRRIVDIEPDDRVLTKVGVYAPVVRKWRKMHKGDMIRIKVRGIGFQIECTPDHIFFACEDGRGFLRDGRRCSLKPIKESLGQSFEIKAKDIKPGTHFLEWPITTDLLDKPGYANDDYCDLAGWYLSEGWLELEKSKINPERIRAGRIGISLHEKEANIAENLGKIMMRLCPPKTHGRGSGATATIVKSNKQKSICLRYGSAVLAQRLYEDFGKGAAEKRIPSWVLCGSSGTIRRILRGMFLGDGHMGEKTMFLSTISPNIAFGTQVMLERLGIGSNLKITSERIGKDGQSHRTSYYINVQNYQDQVKLAEVLGVEFKRREPPKKYLYSPLVENKRLHRVISCERVEYYGYVYDLWVDHPTHSYVTAVGAVSNCHPRDCVAMSWLSEKLNLSCDLFDSLMHAREFQTEWLVHLFTTLGKGMKKVVLGKTYKPESHIITGSSAILFANMLREKEVEFVHYDPYADLQKPPPYDLGEPVAVFIATKHEVFKSFLFPKGSLVIDPFRYIQQQDGVKVIPIGIG